MYFISSLIFYIKNHVRPDASHTRAQGFGVVEVLVVTAIITVALSGLLQTEILAIRLLHAEEQQLEAIMLAQEGLEAVRSIRDESWTNKIAPLIDATSYYPIIENSKWILSTIAPAPINGMYTRTITFASVNRNATDDIAATGTPDPNTRKITVTITWGGNKQIQLVSYITNFQETIAPSTESKVIFYESASSDTDIITFPSNNTGDGDPAQSFTTLASPLNVTRIDAYLRRITSAPSDIYAEIRTSPIGTILGTSNLITASTISASSPAWVEFRFSPTVPLAASTLYYIRLRSIPSSTTSGSGSSGALHWIYANGYGGGAARRYIEKTGPLDQGQVLTQDFGFRIYAQ